MNISIGEAERLVRENCRFERDSLFVPIRDAQGLQLACDVRATTDQPPFPRSAMDGYAVTAADLAKGSVTLNVRYTIEAGDKRELAIKEGEAARIMTGARAPQGACAVVPQEQTDYGLKRVVICEMPERSNISQAGEDFIKGEVLAREGTLCRPYVLSALAASGITEVRVRRRIRVLIAATGDELTDAGRGLSDGMIYDSNSVYIEARLKELGAEPQVVRTRDDIEEIKKAIAREGFDLVITTGGVSVGSRDLVENAVNELRGDIVFHGIDVKPGMPTMFSLVGARPVLSLSGNPYSASAVFEAVRPIGERIVMRAELSQAYVMPRPVLRIVRATCRDGKVGIAGKQLNGAVKSGIGTDALAFLPAGEEPVAAGTELEVIMI